MKAVSTVPLTEVVQHKQLRRWDCSRKYNPAGGKAGDCVSANSAINQVMGSEGISTPVPGLSADLSRYL